MRRLALALVLLLLTSPVQAQVPTEFACTEAAFDLTPCDDPMDFATCPPVCTTPTDPAEEPVCVPLPLEMLGPDDEVGETQPLLRQATVTGGPYTGAVLTMVTLNRSADTVFAAARDQLCVAPPPSPPPPTPPAPTPPSDPGDDTPPVVSGPGLIGGNPGLVGGNPGLVGSNPGINVFRR
jgi:hypothetical protein